MKPVEIAKGIYSVGVTDWNIRDFHGYSTDSGTSYNSFLIVDEKKVLVDTVKKEFSDQHLNNIRQIMDPSEIDMVISNHSEMDHSGSLPGLMNVIGKEKPVYCSKMGKRALTDHFGSGLNLKDVENSGEMSIGKRTLRFLETRMLHWPDSMFTYVKEDGILFSSDAFGQHFASTKTWVDQVGESAVIPHAKKYFANILLPFAPKILKLIEDMKTMDLNLSMICPDHGMLWRDNPGQVIDLYEKWSLQKPSKKAVVLYDTMWNSTEAMANAIVSAIADTGMEVKPLHLRKCHRSDVATEILDAHAILVGSPTLNNGIFPTVSDVLTYIKGLKPQNKISAAFGSFGWSGESVKILNQLLEDMKFQIIDPGVKVKYVPGEDTLLKCSELGKKTAQMMLDAE